jgi:O-antigen/teichoic acid export membrane protein
MVFALLITPIVIFHLGIKNYGIYLFVNVIISFLGLLDLGIGIAVSKHMAFYYGKRDSAGITALTHTANSLFLLIGIFGLIVSLAIAIFGPSFLPAQFASYAQYSMLFIVAGGIFFFNSIDSSYNSILSAVQRFDISNMISIFSLTISSLSILVIVLMGGSLRAIFIVQLLISLLITVATTYYGKKVLPEATLKFGWNKSELKRCYRFGLVAFANNIAATALSSLDRLIIPLFAGPSNLTYYSIPGNVTMRIPGFTNTLGTTIFPTASQLDGGNDRARIEALYVRSSRLITTVAAALTITAISFAYKTLLFWLNADFAEHSANILIILAVTNFILALLGSISGFLLGIGKLKFLATMSVIMGILNAILLVILLPKYGIIGAAWAYLFSIMPVIYMFYYTETHYLALSGRKKYYVKKIFGTLAVSAAIWMLDTFILSFLVVNLATLLLIGATSIAIYFLLYKLFGFFEKEDWHDMELFFVAVKRRVGVRQS